MTDLAYDFSKAESDIQVLVLDAETRHLSAEEAYKVVYRIARSTWDADVSNFTKRQILLCEEILEASWLR